MPAVEVDTDDTDVPDEGSTPREQEEDEENLPPDHAFLEEHTLTAQRDDIAKGLTPVNPSLWPDVDPNPINEFDFSANVTGSDSYWSKKRRELIMQQKKMGSAFFTFSFADNHWHDLHCLMPSGLLQPRKRYKNILKNPHLADWFFSERLGSFIKHFFKGTLDFEWIWHRYEWQSRTAIHAHGVVRLKNDPGISDLVAIVYKGRLAAENLKRPDFLISHNDEQLNRFRQMVSDGEAAKDRVIKYADTLQTAINPKTDQQAENCVPDLLIHAQLTLLLRSVTLTQWTPITKKFAIVYNVISVVQMDIANPKLVENVDSITHFQTSRNPALSLSQLAEQDQSKPIVHKRNDPFLNVHNRVMLEHWRANVDLQLILDSHAAITYMTKYAAKGEKAGRSLQTIVKTVVQKGNATDNASTAIRSAIVRSVGNRDIGQGET